MPGNATHFEIPADDVKRARKFYEQVFGWEINRLYGSDYLYIKTEKDGPKAPHMERVTGGLDKRDKLLRHVTVVFEVESIERTLKIVEKSGGKVVREKHPVEDFGSSAYFRDSEGNVLGLFEVVKE
jgi:uncharacterized protein